MVSARRGFARAVGALPLHVVAQSQAVLDSALKSLLTACRADSRAVDPDAESRRQGVVGLAELVVRVGVDGGDGSAGGEAASASLTRAQLDEVLDTLLGALEDYATDDRGDVGSWVRRASMDAIFAVVTAICLPPPRSGLVAGRMEPGCQVTTPYGPAVVERLRADKKTCVLVWARPALGAWYFPYGRGLLNTDRVVVDERRDARGVLAAASKASCARLTSEQCERIVGAFLKQLSEKMDSVRKTAGQCLEVREERVGCLVSGPVVRVLCSQRRIVTQRLTPDRVFLAVPMLLAVVRAACASPVCSACWSSRGLLRKRSPLLDGLRSRMPSSAVPLPHLTALPSEKLWCLGTTTRKTSSKLREQMFEALWVARPVR